MSCELAVGRTPVALQAPAAAHLAHPAVIDALSLLRRHVGGLGAVHAMLHTGAGRGREPRGATPLSIVAPLNTPYSAWARSWRALAAQRPDVFLWHPARLGAGASPFSLAFLYARENCGGSLRPLRLRAREEEAVRSGRRLLAELTGLSGYGTPARLYEFTARCVALRSVPSLAGEGSYAAWSYAEEPRLRRHAVFSVTDLHARRSQPGGWAEVAGLVLHELTHAAAATHVSAGRELRTGTLGLWVEEAVTSALELTVEHHSLCRELPDVRALRRGARSHGYAGALLALLALMDADEADALRPWLGRCSKLMLRVLSCGQDDERVARELNAFADMAWTPAQWEAVFVPAAAA